MVCHSGSHGFSGSTYGRLFLSAGDFIKMILALLIAPQIRKQLDAAGLAR